MSGLGAGSIGHVEKLRRTTGAPRWGYPWDEWLDPDRTVRVTRGVDFDKPVESFRTSAYGVAKTMGGSVKTRRGVDEAGREYVDIDYYPPEEPEEEPGEPAIQVVTATRQSAKVGVDGSRVLIQITKDSHITHVTIDNGLFSVLREGHDGGWEAEGFLTFP